jgi:hypothetical protein
MNSENSIENITQAENASRFSKRFDSVTYEVSVNFKHDAKETLDEKVIRLIKNELETVT